MSTLELTVFLTYSSLLLVLSYYGSHRIWMTYLHYRHKFRLPTPAGRFGTPRHLHAELGFAGGGIPALPLNLPLLKGAHAAIRAAGVESIVAAIMGERLGAERGALIGQHGQLALGDGPPGLGPAARGCAARAGRA